MKKKEVFGVDGVYSPPKKEESYYHLSYKNPPKVKTKEEEAKEKKAEPNFLTKLYRRITKKKAL